MADGLPQRKRTLVGEKMIFTETELALIQGCWSFMDAMQRDEPGYFPTTCCEYSMLEAYLVLAHASSQAGLYRFNKMVFGDAGVRFIFPLASTMHEVSDEHWYAFAEKTSALRRKITECQMNKV